MLREEYENGRMGLLNKTELLAISYRLLANNNKTLGNSWQHLGTVEKMEASVYVSLEMI